MNTIQIYCKANKRNRAGQSISVCGHIIKEGQRYVEDAYVIDMQGNGILLELTALMNALLDEEEYLTKDKVLELYVCNEYIYKALKNKEEKNDTVIKEEKYVQEWAEINTLINNCGSFKCQCTEKKYRDENNEEMIKCMAHLNKIVCEKVNTI